MKISSHIVLIKRNHFICVIVTWTPILASRKREVNKVVDVSSCYWIANSVGVKWMKLCLYIFVFCPLSSYIRSCVYGNCFKKMKQFMRWLGFMRRVLLIYCCCYCCCCSLLVFLNPCFQVLFSLHFPILSPCHLHDLTIYKP